MSDDLVMRLNELSTPERRKHAREDNRRVKSMLTIEELHMHYKNVRARIESAARKQQRSEAP